MLVVLGKIQSLTAWLLRSWRRRADGAAGPVGPCESYLSALARARDRGLLL